MATRMNGRNVWTAACAMVLCAGSTVSLAQADEDALGLGLADMAAALSQAARDAGAPVSDPDDNKEYDLPDLEGEVSVDENMIVELHVQDEDLANVLQLLSLQSQRNIVANKDVSATVTANLYGVTFYEALDAILHINGYGWVEKGNFIYVYTAEQLEQMVDQRERVAKTIRLNYLTAVDAAEFVTPMLSEGGFIKTNGATSDFSIGGEGPIGADDYANGAVMVVFDYAENIDAIEELVAEIDTRPAQVLVEATILQSSLSEANAFGVDFSLVADLDIESFVNHGGPLGAVDSLIGGSGAKAGADGGVVASPGDNEGRAITSTPGNTAGPATLKVGIIDEDVAVFVRMLDEVSDTTILSNPKILSLNRQPSRVLVGRKVGYLSTTSTETSTTQTVEFLDTGTQLYFRPFVTNNGLIRMELKPQVSEAIIRDATDASGAVVTIPDEITNEIVTNVIVPDGNTVVLGGLFRESTDSTRRQVPWIGDIPFIGAAFRGHEDQTDRSEIIFMIKPSIVSDQVLLEQGERGMDNARRARAGAREGLLPWSRERQTSQLLIEADRLAAEGNVDRALYCVRRALAHNPYQADAIAMRERLMNQQETWPTRSILGHVVDNELFDADPTPDGGYSYVPSFDNPGAPANSGYAYRTYGPNPHYSPSHPGASEQGSSAATAMTGSTQPFGSSNHYYAPSGTSSGSTTASTSAPSSSTTPAPYYSPSDTTPAPTTTASTQSPSATSSNSSQPFSSSSSVSSNPYYSPNSGFTGSSTTASASPTTSASTTSTPSTTSTMPSKKWPNGRPVASDPSTWSPNPFFSGSAGSTAEVAGAQGSAGSSNPSDPGSPTNADEQGTAVSSASTEPSDGE